MNTAIAINNAIIRVLEDHALGTLSQYLAWLIPFLPVNFQDQLRFQFNMTRKADSSGRLRSC